MGEEGAVGAPTATSRARNAASTARFHRLQRTVTAGQQPACVHCFSRDIPGKETGGARRQRLHHFACSAGGGGGVVMAYRERTKGSRLVDVCVPDLD